MKRLDLLAFLACLAVAASGQVPVRGIVHDPNHRPIPGAAVTLTAAPAATDARVRSTQANARGEFRFAAVPPGRYLLRAQATGFRSGQLAIDIDRGHNPIFHVLLQISSQSQEVTVTSRAERLNTTTSTTQTSITKAQIIRTPGASMANSEAMITDFVPGAYVVHDMLHVRGGHQESWYLDGIPVVSTSVAASVGPLLNPNNIDELQVQSGGYSAAADDRGYGLFNVITPSGFSQSRQAQLITSFGSQDQTNDQLSFANHSQTTAWYASLDGNFSTLGLYTPTAQVLHDRTAGLGAFFSAIYNPSARNQVRALVSLQGNDYQIPNTPAAQAVGIRDVDVERDNLLGLSWTHSFVHGEVLTLAPFYHFNEASYQGGPTDTPYALTDARRSNYYGTTANLLIPWKGQQLQVGGLIWAEQDNTFFHLLQNPGPPVAGQTFTPSANSEEAYVEDSDQVLPWLNLNGGLHVTRYAGLIQEAAADPRAGASIRVPWLAWYLHGYYSQYYQQPPLDTISGPLLGFTQQQGYGFVPLHGERDQQWDVGLTMPLVGPLNGWGLNVDHFHTFATNFLDHDEIGNSDIFLPLTDSAARIQGNEFTLYSPLVLRHAHVNVVWSNQIAQGLGPVTGGLLEFAPTGYFYLDHDQRNTVNVVASSNLPAQAWTSISFQYGSGFLNGNGPAHLPPNSIWGLALGKQIGEHLAASLNVTNLFNTSYLLDNSNTFGGTHWQYPRQIFGELRWKFHY